MNRRTGLLLLGAALLGAPAPAAELVLADLLDESLVADPSVRAAREREAAAEAKAGRTWLEYVPDFKIGTNTVIFDGSPISIFSLHDVEQPDIITRQVSWGAFGALTGSASMPLWGPQAPGWDLGEKRRLARRKTSEQLTQRQRQTALRTAKLAIEREHLLELIPAWRRAVANQTELESTLGILVSQGELPPSDHIEAGNHKAELLAALDQAETQVAIIGRLLATWLDNTEPLPTAQRIRPPGGDYTWAMDPVLLESELTTHSPEIKIGDIAIIEARNRVDALRIANLPDVQLSASYTTGTSFQNNRAELITAGISVSIPITTGIRNSREKIEALREQRAQAGDAEAIRRDLQTAAFGYSGQLRSLAQTLATRQRTAALRRSQSLETEARAAAGSTIERSVLDSRQKAIEAEIDLIDQTYALRALWCEIAIQTGRSHEL